MRHDTGIDRRIFLQSTATAAIAVASRDPELLAADKPTKLPTADQFIAGKDRRLLVHSATTGEIETPLELLRAHRITPKEILFVRNNQLLPDTLTLAPAVADDWQVELAGMLESPRAVRVADLAKLPQREVEIVLQCSGNSRSRFAQSVPAEGVPWQHGAMANVVYRGVPLKELVERYELKIKSAARYVAAEGQDSPVKPGTPDFEHSLPLGEALERSILALSMNGEPLPKVHGGPVRLVTPGFYATMHVKWLSALRFEDRESVNHHHVGRYRTPRTTLPPGAPFISTLENSDPNWNMRIKSVIFHPLDASTSDGKQLEVRGVAWNDGTVKIDRVEISIDGGESWLRTELAMPASPFAWHHWKRIVDLPAGPRKILSRAIDVQGTSQPLDGAVGWNPAGYAWNGVDSVTVSVRLP